MPPLKKSHAEPEFLLTLTMLFLDKYSGTYRSREALRTKLDQFVDKEYDGDFGWLNREKDMDVLVDLVIRSGGVSVVEDESLGNEVKRATIESGEK